MTPSRRPIAQTEQSDQTQNGLVAGLIDVARETAERMERDTAPFAYIKGLRDAFLEWADKKNQGWAERFPDYAKWRMDKLITQCEIMSSAFRGLYAIPDDATDERIVDLFKATIESLVGVELLAEAAIARVHLSPFILEHCHGFRFGPGTNAKDRTLNIEISNHTRNGIKNLCHTIQTYVTQQWGVAKQMTVPLVIGYMVGLGSANIDTLTKLYAVSDDSGGATGGPKNIPIMVYDEDERLAKQFASLVRAVGTRLSGYGIDGKVSPSRLMAQLLVLGEANYKLLAQIAISYPFPPPTHSRSPHAK